MPTHGRGLYRPSSAPPDDPEYAPPSGAAPEYELTPLIPAELREGRAVHVRHDVADSDPPRSARRPFGQRGNAERMPPFLYRVFTYKTRREDVTETKSRDITATGGEARSERREDVSHNVTYEVKRGWRALRGERAHVRARIHTHPAIIVEAEPDSRLGRLPRGNSVFVCAAANVEEAEPAARAPFARD